MITEASKPLALFLRLGALTGARRGQLCGLRWSDIDLDAATIRWTRSLRKVPGGTVDKETTSKARWSVSLDPATVELLRAHRRRSLETALAAGAQLPAGAYVFARDPVGKLPWHPDGATQRFAALRRKLKLDGVRLHDLRHWMATEGLGGGADIETIAGPRLVRGPRHHHGAGPHRHSSLVGCLGSACRPAGGVRMPDGRHPPVVVADRSEPAVA